MATTVADMTPHPTKTTTSPSGNAPRRPPRHPVDDTMISTKDFHKKLKIEIDGEPFEIIKCDHVKPGKGVAFVKTKIKSLIDGHVEHENFRSGDTVDTPELETREMEFLYAEDPHFIFMDTETYEQVRVGETAVEEALPFLKDNMELRILFFEGNPIQVDMPTFVDLEVKWTEPGFAGDTAQGATKPAELETGHEVEVPLYMETGETVRVDTRSGEYVERVND